MTILVTSQTGSVGKSVIANALKRMLGESVQHWAIESLNTAACADRMFNSGSDFTKIIREMIAAENPVVMDFGHSEISAVMSAAKEANSMLRMFDTIVVPMLPNDRDHETEKFTDKLIELDFPLKRVNIVINNAPRFQPSGSISSDAARISQETGVRLLPYSIPTLAFFREAMEQKYMGDAWTLDLDEYKHLEDRARRGDVHAAGRLILMDGAVSVRELFSTVFKPIIDDYQTARGGL